MKQVKKRLSLVLALLMVFSLVACGGNNTSDGEDSSTNTNANTVDTNTSTDAPATDDVGWKPSQPIELVVPASPGGDTDLNARLLAKYLSKELGQEVVILNVSGGGGTLGINEVINGEKDGYRLLFYHANAIASMVSGTIDYNFFDEFKFLACPTKDGSTALFASVDSGINSVESLIVAAQKNPGKISCAVEIGGLGWMQLMQIEQMAGIDLNLFDGGSSADKLSGILGGQFETMLGMVGSMQDYVADGSMNMIGTFSAERLPKWPDLPTLKEQGIDMTYEKYCFVAAHKDVPEEVCQALEEAIIKTTQNPEYQQESLDLYGIEIVQVGSEEGTQLFKNLYNDLSEAVKADA